MHLALTLGDPLVQLTGLVALGAAIHWTAARTSLPAVILLLLSGLAIGPILGLFDPDELFGKLLEPLISLAVGYVLFEGGLSLKLREARQLGKPLARIVIVGLVVAFGLGSLGAHYIGGLSWGSAATIAAILVVTGPTVIRPMLRQARLPNRPARLLKWEGIVNDPLGALLAVTVVEIVVATSGAEADGIALWAVPFFVAAAAGVGWLGGYLLARALDGGAVPQHLKTPVTIAWVAVVFTAAEAFMHEAGLLSTTMMGVAFANSGSPNVEGVRRFKEDIVTLLVALLFLVLAARLELEQMTSMTLGEAGFVAAILFVIRPVSILTALTGTSLPRNERLLIGWIAPRGIVAAAMAAALAPRLADAGLPDADRLVPVLFAVVLATVVLHGLTVGPVARRLGVGSRREPGLLIVGGSRWASDLVRTLEGANIQAVVVDGDYRRVNRSRLSGVEAYYGEVIDEHTLDDLPTERLDTALVATADDSYNALASVALVDTFGRENVAQLTPDGERDAENPLQGRVLWGEAGSFDRITLRFLGGARFRVAQLTKEYDIEDFHAAHPDSLVLFTIGNGDIKVANPEGDWSDDARLVHLS